MNKIDKYCRSHGIRIFSGTTHEHHVLIKLPKYAGELRNR